MQVLWLFIRLVLLICEQKLRSWCIVTLKANNRLFFYQCWLSIFFLSSHYIFLLVLDSTLGALLSALMARRCKSTPFESCYACWEKMSPFKERYSVLWVEWAQCVHLDPSDQHVCKIFKDRSFLCNLCTVHNDGSHLYSFIQAHF